MSLGPILPGRIPNSLMGANFVSDLTSIDDALNKVENQISSGQQYSLPSDNPTATLTGISLQEQLQANAQDTTSATTDQGFLGATDSALQNVSSTLSQANALLLSGIGTTTSTAEKQSLATQVNTIIQGLVNTANSTFEGRYIFGGSQSTTPPFTTTQAGVVRYNGDQFSINSYVDGQFQIPNNVDGITAFGAISTPVGSDVDPALTLQTDLSDLNSGRGVSLGQIQVTVDNGVAITKTVDLSKAQTVSDVQQAIQNAFAPGTVTVSITAGPPQDGLQITPSGGTVSVADLNGGKTAADLGIASGPVASITGSDLSPNLTLQTPLSAFNGGAGISNSHGIIITDGSGPQTVNISSDVTVQDLFNTLQTADPNLDVGINSAGNGLAISTRLSGVNFSIGENGGNDATSLGIRTLTASTPLSELNLGQGVPVNGVDSAGNPISTDLTIQLRDGSTVNVNLAGAQTVQDVLNDINAVSPGKLVATLNSVGNGISITDNDGMSTGPLIVQSNALSTALGIAGTQSSTDPTQPLVGQDVNPIQANGMFNLLEQLSTALSSGNNAELTQLQPLFTKEITRVSGVQGSLGSNEQLLSQIQSQLGTDKTNLTSALSTQMDTNMTEAITQLTQLTTSLQATMQVTASSMQMSLFKYL